MSDALRDRERDQYLAILKGYEGRRRDLDESEYLIIQGARDTGATWEQVADALGLVSREAALQRHDRLGRRVNPAAPAGQPPAA